MFGWFSKRQKSLKEMSLKEVTENLYETFPSMQTRGEYVPPDFRCSRWILLCGPAYQDDGYFGTFILDATQIYEKLKRIDENMSVSVEAEEQAKHFLPQWIRDANLQDETVTFLDYHQQNHLKPWLLDFISIESCEIWCPTCKSSNRKMIENDGNHSTEGLTTKWVAHWVCTSGHDLRLQDQSVRWIV